MDDHDGNDAYYIAHLEAKVDELERDVQVYWDGMKRANELLSLIHEKLNVGKNREALDLLEQGGE